VSLIGTRSATRQRPCEVEICFGTRPSGSGSHPAVLVVLDVRRQNLQKLFDFLGAPTVDRSIAVRLQLIWGGVAGAKMHELLHGANLASPKTERASISHQHVLAPKGPPPSFGNGALV
jgi:hypothetical protein